MDAICKVKSKEYQSFNIYFQDESRFGLITRNGRMLTSKGIKPICPVIQEFKNTYLFGAFSPLDGNSLLIEMPLCNSEAFQLFVNQLSALEPTQLKIVVVDNASFHKAKTLEIPPDIVLLFLPPYSPELNPAEKMWAHFKRRFTNLLCKTLDDVKSFLNETSGKLNREMIKSICSYNYIAD